MKTFKVKKIPAIIAIFQEAQSEDSSHSQLICKLTRVFNQMNVEHFTRGFITCLKKALVAQGDVTFSGDHVLAFAVKFLISMVGLNSSEDETPPEEILQFWFDVFRFMNESHRIPDLFVRKRICQFVSKFMLEMNAEVELDCKICDVVIEIMSERIKDKVPIVRTQAVLAIYRLQDGSDKNCPITKMLLNCIETDSCAEVRKLALSKISLKHKAVVRKLIDRMDDISEKVRKETYVVFSRLHPQYFTIKERKQLLYTGLYDNNETVKNTVKNTLLPAWLKRMDDDYVNFLHSFNVDTESAELMTKALMSLIENTPAEKSKAAMDSCLDSLHLISFDKLTCESAFYWRCYVFYDSELVSEKDNYRWHSNKSYDATSAGLLPDLSVFCEYIKTYYNNLANESTNMEAWKKKEQEFILIQLIELCKVYDYADEVGRKELKTLCLELIQRVHIDTVKPIVELYFMLQTNLYESICKITEIINDLLHPPGDRIEEIISLNEVTKKQSLASCQSRSELTPDQAKDLKYKLAQLEVCLDELKEQQEDAVKLEDYEKAMALKPEISDIREKINSLKDSLYAKPMSLCYDDVPESDDGFSEGSDENEMAKPLENLDPDVVLRCLVILREMLHLPFVKQLCPELRTLFQDFVLHTCKSNEYTIAPWATEVLGSFCLRDETLAKEYFTTFFALCGNSDICVSALKVIFDLLLCFGPATFNINNLSDEKNDEDESKISEYSRQNSGASDGTNLTDDESKSKQNEADGMISGYTFISVLVDLLDDEYAEARCVVVHGLCKLMATGKLKSAKVLMRLILIWFHPTSRESVEIRDTLNFFFPFFRRRCSWALQLFEEAFIPTMETLFNAPPINPLCEIDQKSIIKVLCDLTSPNFVHLEGESEENIHSNLAVLLCNTIIELSEPAHQAVLLKALEYLDLSSVDPSTLTTIKNLIGKLIKKFKKKNYKKMVADAEKFKAKLNTIVQQDCGTEAVSARMSVTVA